MRTIRFSSQAGDRRGRISGIFGLRLPNLADLEFVKEWYKSGELNRILLSGLFGILTLLLLRAAMSTSKTSFVWARGLELFKRIRKNHEKDARRYLMIVLSLIGKSINMIFKLAGPSLRKVMKVLPFFSTLLTDSAECVALYEKRKWGFLSGSSVESNALLGLLFIVRCLITIMGLLANIAQLHNFSKVLAHLPSSSAAILNFSGQFVLAGLIEAFINRKPPTLLWLVGTSFIMLGALLVAKYSIPSRHWH